MTNIMAGVICRSRSIEKAREMTERPKFFDDLAGVAGGAISAFAGLKEELSSLVKARVEETIRRLDLVRRDEFEAMSELARRAREGTVSPAIAIPEQPRQSGPNDEDDERER